MGWDYLIDETEISFDVQLLEQIEQKQNDQVESTLQESKELCNAVDVSGASLLHYVAEYGNETITKFLIKSGSKINLQNKDGNTPLLLATKKQHLVTIKVLLDSDADIHICDNKNVSSLQFAIHTSPMNVKILELFLKQVSNECSLDNAEITKTLIRNNCPLYIAVLLKNLPVSVIMLTNRSAINAKDKVSGKTALHISVENLDLEHVENLVNFGADLNVKDASGKTPLAMLTDFSKLNEALNILDILIKAKTDLTLCDNDGFMQIRSILENGPCEGVKKVLESFIDLNVIDQNKQNVIHYLAKNCNPGIVEFIEQSLILESINVNARDVNGFTALHFAMNAGNANFVKTLIMKHANKHILNNEGLSPLLQAFDSTSEDTLEKRIECVEIVLQYAKHPIIYMGEYFEMNNTKSAINRDYQLLKPIIADIILWNNIWFKDEFPINQDIMDKINSYPKLKEYYELCISELENMKNDKIYKSLSLFDIIESDDKYVTALDYKYYNFMYSRIDTLADKYKSIPFYRKILKDCACVTKANLKNDIRRFFIWACIGIVCALMLDLYMYYLNNILFRPLAITAGGFFILIYVLIIYAIHDFFADF